jgi:CRP/FNR family transcriptional regulator, cyclic AMP receptor protein
MSQTALDLDLLTRRGLPLRRFDAGERIFLEDDAGDCMYVVRTGRVDVITFGTVLETLGPGGIFGEMALIDAGARSAAALAGEATEVAVIDRTAFDAILREEPEFALAIMRLLAARIRRLDAALRRP